MEQKKVLDALRCMADGCTGSRGRLYKCAPVVAKDALKLLSETWEWTRLEEQLPPAGEFLLARGIDDDPVYQVARRVTRKEVGEEYIRYCTMDGWEILPESEYHDSAWCLIHPPEKRKRRHRGRKDRE